jgi:leucyl/phenylalanyl-tRNA---protein transferase
VSPPPQSLPPSHWEFDPARWPDDDCVAVGADLAPETVVSAYSAGAFPMPVDDVAPMVWWSPLRRGVLFLDDLTVSRSLRRSVRGFEIRVDTAFDAVIEGCADPKRPGAWINHAMLSAYQELHALGWAHSIETWTPDGELAGGLYGLAIGGLFAGESMFYRRRDASKVALAGLVELLRDEYADRRLIDVQWRTPHLATLGVSDLSRADYLGRLPALVDEVPLPEPWR